jgi:hypothetical protein
MEIDQIMETTRAVSGPSARTSPSGLPILVAQVAGIVAAIFLFRHYHGHPRFVWAMASCCWIGLTMGLHNRGPSRDHFIPGFNFTVQKGGRVQAAVGGVQFGEGFAGAWRWSLFLALALGCAAGGSELWITTVGPMSALRGLAIGACFVPLMANVLPEQWVAIKAAFVTPDGGEFERHVDRLAAVYTLYVLVGLLGAAAVLQAAGVLGHFNAGWFLVVISPLLGVIKGVFVKRHL